MANLTSFKICSSERKMEELARYNSDVRGYKRISGNSRYGTYVVDVVEGRKFPR